MLTSNARKNESKQSGQNGRISIGGSNPIGCDPLQMELVAIDPPSVDGEEATAVREASDCTDANGITVPGWYTIGSRMMGPPIGMLWPCTAHTRRLSFGQRAFKVGEQQNPLEGGSGKVVAPSRGS